MMAQSANCLRSMRKQKGFSQQGLAVAANAAPSLLVMVERYDYLPGPDVRQRLVKVLNCAESEIWSELDQVTV